jgi:hypothetical protein
MSLIFEVIRNKRALFCVKENTKGRLVAEVNEETMADFRIAVLRGIMLMAG